MSILEVNNNTIHIPTIPEQTNNLDHNLAKRNISHQLLLKDAPNQNIVDIAEQSNATTIAKEALSSMIPIYGTIQAFKKGEIGWGIFGIVTDIISLVPVVGYGAKLTGALIRGGKATSTIIKSGSIIGAGITIAKESNAATIMDDVVNVSKIKENNIISEMEDMIPASYTANQNHNINSQEIKLTTKLPADEPVKINAGESAPVAQQIIWHELPINDDTAKLYFSVGKYCFFDYHLLAADKVYKNLRDASKASEFIVDGQKIDIDIPDKMLESLKKMFPNDFKKIQLISAYAHDGVLSRPMQNLIPQTENRFLYTSPRETSSYQFTTLKNGDLQFVAKFEGKYIRGDQSLTKEYHNYGIKVSSIINKNYASEFNYSYYS